MKAKRVHETISSILQPKGVDDVLNSIKNLSVDRKIDKLKEMERTWKGMYKDLLSNPDIIEDIRTEVKKELEHLSVLRKVDYIERIENKLPDIFSGMRDKNLLNGVKNYIIDQSFEEKSMLLWKFYKTWPDLFKDVEEDSRIDSETNQLMLLFKIKTAIDDKEIESLQDLIKELGNKYGRETILDKAGNIDIPSGRLFNKKDIEQLKLSLYKETRSDDEMNRDEYFDVYAFIGYSEYKETNVDGEIFHKKILGIENLVKIDKYDASSLRQVSMMKLRANSQYDRKDPNNGVWGVYIPKHLWDKDYAYNNDIPDNLRKYIEENKFKI